MARKIVWFASVTRARGCLGKVLVDCGRTVVVDYHVPCILVSEPEALCVVGEMHDLGLKASLLHHGIVDICRRRGQIPGQ